MFVLKWRTRSRTKGKIKEIVTGIVISRLSIWGKFDWRKFVEDKTKEIMKVIDEQDRLKCL